MVYGMQHIILGTMSIQMSDLYDHHHSINHTTIKNLCVKLYYIRIITSGNSAVNFLCMFAIHNNKVYWPFFSHVTHSVWLCEYGLFHPAPYSHVVTRVGQKFYLTWFVKVYFILVYLNLLYRQLYRFYRFRCTKSVFTSAFTDKNLVKVSIIHIFFCL